MEGGKDMKPLSNPPKPARHLSLVQSQPKVLDARGTALEVSDLVCLLARQYSQRQLNEVWRIESLASDVAKVRPIRGFLKPLSYDFPLKDIVLYAKQGAPTPYLEVQS
jgi:hypothetical protein